MGEIARTRARAKSELYIMFRAMLVGRCWTQVIVKPGDDPYRLRRICLSDDGGTSELLVKTSGLWVFACLLMSRARGRRDRDEVARNRSEQIYPMM